MENLHFWIVARLDPCRSTDSESIILHPGRSVDSKFIMLDTGRVQAQNLSESTNFGVMNKSLRAERFLRNDGLDKGRHYPQDNETLDGKVFQKN